MENKEFTLEELINQNPERYFQKVLDASEFKKLKTFVDSSEFFVLWEELVDEGVVKIEGKKVEGIYRKGDLEIYGTSIRKLRKIKRVEGNLLAQEAEKLEDLGDLEFIGGELDIQGTSVKSLGKLKKIEGSLECRGVKTLKDLGELEEVGGTVILEKTRITTLGYLKKVKGDFLNCQNIETLKTLGALEEVGGALYCAWSINLEDLGKLKKVGGDCELNETKIKTLGKLLSVGGHLNCIGLDTLESLGNLRYVKWNCNLRNTSITTLGNLETVGGDIDCENVRSLESVGSLKSIGKGKVFIIDGVSIKFRLEMRKLQLEKQLEEFILSQDDYIETIYDEQGKLDYNNFRKIFGENIREIEDEFIKKNAIRILLEEYRNEKKNIFQEVEAIKKNNIGKKLSNGNKKNLKEKLTKLDRKLNKLKQKIEGYGVEI